MNKKGVSTLFDGRHKNGAHYTDISKYKVGNNGYDYGQYKNGQYITTLQF